MDDLGVAHFRKPANGGFDGNIWEILNQQWIFHIAMFEDTGG